MALMDYSQSYGSWLSSHHYSSATIRNYLVDLNKFILFCQDSKFTFLSEEILIEYLTSLSGDNNQKRYLASLNTFCQFAVDQQLINTNYLVKIRRKIRQNTQITQLEELSNLSHIFSDHLQQQHHSPSTIRNYINDINQYISWITKIT
jgi:site-specific recombinase XerD